MTRLFIFLCLLPALGLAWDNDPLDTAWRRDQPDALITASQGDDFTALYAHYRLAMVAIRDDDKKQAKQSLETVQKTLKTYQSCDEAALYSASLGLSITLKPWQAAFIAGRAGDALEYCAQTPPHAPTLMVEGVALYNTPSLLGGDREQALSAFNRALEQYRKEDAWGHEDAWLWKIKALMALERTEEARTTHARATEKFPDYVELSEIAP